MLTALEGGLSQRIPCMGSISSETQALLTSVSYKYKGRKRDNPSPTEARFDKTQHSLSYKEFYCSFYEETIQSHTLAHGSRA